MTVRVNIGYLSAEAAGGPHIGTFSHLIPEDVHMDFDGLGIVSSPMDYARLTTAHIISRVSTLAQKYKWDGIIMSGGPIELYNPGLLQRLETVLNIPAATALTSVIAALQSFSATRVLLLTPFDASLNKLHSDYLGHHGIEVILPVKEFPYYTESLRLSPEDVFALTREAIETSAVVQAVYFQGAMLDPVKVVDRIEVELHTTVVPSTLAMFWFILSKLGFKYCVRGGGKLLEQWPNLPPTP